jgi:hypothetical protein
VRLFTRRYDWNRALSAIAGTAIMSHEARNFLFPPRRTTHHASSCAPSATAASRRACANRLSFADNGGDSPHGCRSSTAHLHALMATQSSLALPQTHIDRDARWGADKERQPLPVSGNAERPLPAARGTVDGPRPRVTEMPSGTAVTAQRRSQIGGRSPLSFVRCVRWLRATRRSSPLIALSPRPNRRS